MTRKGERELGMTVEEKKEYAFNCLNYWNKEATKLSEAFKAVGNTFMYGELFKLARDIRGANDLWNEVFNVLNNNPRK